MAISGGYPLGEDLQYVWQTRRTFQRERKIPVRREPCGELEEMK